jgi:hypothetical protein
MGFKEYINEDTDKPFNSDETEYKKVYIRTKNQTTPDKDSMQKSFGGDIYGFIATKYNNAAGYIVSSLSNAEKKDFGSDAYRVSSEKTHTTTVAKIDLKKGKITFLDNEEYEEGNLKWQSPMAFTRLLIDNNTKAAKAFGLK